MNPSRTLSALAECKHIDAPQVASKCDLARAGYSRLVILQPLRLGVHFFGSQLYFDLCSVSA